MAWTLFQRSVIKDWINSVEGGYVNNPHDPGGETKYGISKASFPNLDIKNLTLDEAVNIYRNMYWDALLLDNFDFPTAFVIFDTAILCGVGWTGRILKSIDVRNAIVMGVLSARIRYHLDDINSRYFLRGWMERVQLLMQKYLNLLSH
ncbi:MAG: glycosyl hydrolase 108 family protein [Sulfolobaceae archaeon]